MDNKNESEYVRVTLPKKQEDEELKKFCANVLKVYEEHNINSHIIWKK